MAQTRPRACPARSLYGTLPEQLADPLFRPAAPRPGRPQEFGIATGALLDVPDVSQRGMLVMVHQLVDGGREVTVLNFSGQEMAGSIQSSHLPPGANVQDLFTGTAVGQVDDLHSFFLELPAYQGTALLLTEEGDRP